MTDAIAIDFGTSRTKLAYLGHASTPQLMHLGFNQPFLPSLFYLVRDSEQILWGYEAEEMLTEDPAGIVEVLKRHLQDSYVRANRRKISPQQLLTLLLGQLRTRAGEELPAFQGKLPRKALLTMPALYGPAVEKLLQEAARTAGFAEVELVSEPVAAARAWLAETGTADPAVVVLDCGGGTLDLAYLRYRDGEFQLVPECPPTGDVHIGGYDVDQELLDQIQEKVQGTVDDIEQRRPFYLQRARILKEHYCRGMPLRPVRIRDQEIKLEERDFLRVFEERFIQQTCESLKSYLDRVVTLSGGTLPTVLLVGGSARLKGLKEAVESRCHCRAVWWEHSEYATVLGAVLKSSNGVVLPTPPVPPKPDLKPVPTPDISTKPPAPAIQNVHGWSAQQVQALQRQTAQALDLPVEFRDTLKDGSQGPVMVVIPGGRFLMGSPADEPGRRSDERQHEVEVAPFAIGKYAVTFEEYDRFAEVTRRDKPSDKGWGRGRRPVISVSWLDAVAYTEWLSQQTSQTYRLLTEAEWEYACRAGTTKAYYFGASINTDLANYRDFFKPLVAGFIIGVFSVIISAKTVEVGRYPVNAWGLHDMHGNVWEWTCSVYDKDYGGGEQRCAEPGTSGPCVLRGGSWYNVPGRLRGAARSRNYPRAGYGAGGFRLARTFSL